MTVGEEVVLYLSTDDGWDTPAVVGFHQGKFRVHRDVGGRIGTLTRDQGARPDRLPRDPARLRARLGPGRAPGMDRLSERASSRLTSRTRRRSPGCGP